MEGAAFCVRFIRRRRARRREKQFGQVENFSRSHKSAKTRPHFKATPYSAACSRVESFGGENWPCAASASKAPLPKRVGMSEAAVAPQSNAKSSERLAQ